MTIPIVFAQTRNYFDDFSSLTCSNWTIWDSVPFVGDSDCVTGRLIFNDSSNLGDGAQINPLIFTPGIISSPLYIEYYSEFLPSLMYTHSFYLFNDTQGSNGIAFAYNCGPSLPCTDSVNPFQGIIITSNWDYGNAFDEVRCYNISLLNVTGEHKYDYKVNPNGEITVYYDDTKICNYTSEIFNNGNYFESVVLQTAGYSSFTLDNFYVGFDAPPNFPISAPPAQEPVTEQVREKGNNAFIVQQNIQILQKQQQATTANNPIEQLILNFRTWLLNLIGLKP